MNQLMDRDGDGCTGGETCEGGECTGGVDICGSETCAVDEDCVPGEDGDLCNGMLFCNDALNPPM